MLNWMDLWDIYEDELDDYEAHAYYLHQPNSDWNKSEIKLLHIAFHILLGNNMTTRPIEPDRKKAIDKTVAKVRKKVFLATKGHALDKKIQDLQKRIEANKKEWFFKPHNDIGNIPLNYIIEQRLGKYAEYFKRPLNPNKLNCYSEHQIKTYIRDTQSKYLSPKEAYVLKCVKGEKDEIDIIKDFFDHLEEEQDELIELARKLKKNTKNAGRNNTKNLPKLTDLYNSLKGILAERLRLIGVSPTKIGELTASAKKAIQKEILH